jgi:hypothetical protein
VVIDSLLDDSPRGKGRSPAWQKCIVHQSPAVAKYEQVAWVDADIRIRPGAPNLFDNVPPGQVGAVDDYGTPNKEDHDMMLERLYRQWDAQGVAYISNRTAQEYHARFGLVSPFEEVVQTGVLVFSPQRHGGLFQSTYDNYEDKGSSEWNYEMRPLSYELLKSGFLHWISPKFNMGWPVCESLYYPFLQANPSRVQRLIHRIWQPKSKLRRQCVERAFENNYFLHFAGGSRDYMLIPPGRE